MEQYFFNYDLKPNLTLDDFFIGNSNINAFDILINKDIENNNLFLLGPNKSGKTHLSQIWKKKYHALIYNNNLNELINQKKNILIDNLFNNINEEDIFHLINHCNIYNLRILITSNLPLNDFKFNIYDLLSRLKTFYSIKIDLPDDELLINLMMKLFKDQQIIVKKQEIFHYIIKRIDRSYEKVFILVDQIDKLLLKKNKQLTIPLIKELI
jgi:chromosomal replication initiation ATPase DnaA